MIGNMEREPSNQDLLNAILNNQRAIGTLTVGVGELKTDVGTLKTDVGELKTDVGTLKTDVGELKTNVGVLKTDVGELKTDVGALQSDVGEMKNKFERIESDIGTLKFGMVSLTEQMQENTEAIQGLATHMDDRFDHLDGRVTKIEATMVTKGYLDDKLAEEGVRHGARIRRTNARIDVLTGALVKEKSLSAKAAKTVMASA